MVKNAALSIRVAPEVKDELEALAAKAGMSVASYAERALRAHISPPKWVLDHAELVHSIINGPLVKIDVVDGWPAALLPPEQASSLARQLLNVVQIAAATPRGGKSRIDDCLQDLFTIAAKPDSREKKTVAIYARLNGYLSDLDKHLKEFPNQDRGYWISKLEDALTSASTARAHTDKTTSDLLERGIDHLHQRRRARS